VGIYLPVGVEVALSRDGKDFTVAAEAKGDASAEGGASGAKEVDPFVRPIRREVKPQRARFVRVLARNVGSIPAGHPAAGEKAWLFVDEVLVNP
jgi:hexosaminidase